MVLKVNAGRPAALIAWAACKVTESLGGTPPLPDGHRYQAASVRGPKEEHKLSITNRSRHHSQERVGQVKQRPLHNVHLVAVVAHHL